jgi:hypothetical protein
MDPRFTLYEGSVIDYPFPRVYTGIIYCAVHHHVFRLHGKSQAFSTWRKIIQHSNRFVIFETGQICEGARWHWQRAIHSYYSSDEEHLIDLLHAIGPRLKNVSVIDYLPIHRVNRVLLKIELHPLGSSYDTPATGSDAYGSLLNDTVPRIEIPRFRRSIGSQLLQMIDVQEGTRLVRVLKKLGKKAWRVVGVPTFMVLVGLRDYCLVFVPEHAWRWRQLWRPF